jgi:hypothetical protein
MDNQKLDARTLRLGPRPGDPIEADSHPPTTVVADMLLIYHALQRRSQTAQPKRKWGNVP